MSFKYENVHGDDEDSDSATADDTLLEKQHIVKVIKQSRVSSYLHWAAHISGILLLGTLMYTRGLYPPRILEQVHEYSPAREVLSNDFPSQAFFGTVRGKTPYKGPPTPEVIDTWENRMKVGVVNVTREEMIAMNKSLDSVQYPQEEGGGYMALLESAHYVHCLYSLWQDHYITRNRSLLPAKVLKEYDNMGPEIQEIHFEHCVDMIRQKLMCYADPSLITFRWVKGKLTPRPDFNSQHKCSGGKPGWDKLGSGSGFEGYEALYQWNEGRRVRGELARDGFDWMIPEGAVLMETDP